MENQFSNVKENTIITWFDDSQMGDIRDIEKVKDQLGENNVGILFIFDNADECVNFINNIKDNRIILIIGPSTGAKVLRKVLDVPQIQVVFLVCSHHSMRPLWATECGSIRCVTVNSTSVYQQIEIFIANHTVSINILDSSIIPINQNKQDSRFVYNQMFKYVLIEMIYSDDDTNDMIEFFKNKFKHQPVTLKLVEEFGEHYEPNKAIWYYTNYIFLYKTVNLALRTFDIRALYSMRVFLKDLHLQIARLHITTPIMALLKLYRGVVIPVADFEKMKEKTGKVLSFNDFLSTSKNQNVALMFASSSSFNEIAVIFEITINLSMLTTTAFTCIQEMSQYEDEEEYLFTMGSIFRIESIERSNENSRWCIHLTLTEDHDPETTELITYMQSEFKKPSINSLCVLLEYMGKHDVLIDIVNARIKSCKDKSILSELYMMSGCTHMQIGNFQPALEAFQLSLEHSNQCDETKLNTVPTDLITFCVNFIHGDLDLALTNIETMKQSKCFGNSSFLDILKSHILVRQGHCEDTLKCQNEAFNMWIKTLPASHPTRVMSCIQLTIDCTMDNQLDDVLLCMKSQRHSLPPDHFLKGLLDDPNEFDERHEYDDLSFDYLLSNLSDYMTPIKLATLWGHLEKANKWDEALFVLNQYIKVHEEHSTIRHADLIAAYKFRGDCHQKKENLIEALNDFKQSYEIAIKHFGGTYPIILGLLVQIIEIHIELDNYDQALITIEQYKNVLNTDPQLSSIERKKSLFKDILSEFKKRAKKQHRSEEYEKALHGFKSYLKIQIYVLSDDHPDVGETYQSIAMAYQQLSYYPGALYNYKKAQNIFEKHLPSNDSKIGEIWNDLQIIYFRLKQYDDALFACDKYLKFQKNASSLSRMDIAETYTKIANIYYLKKDYLNTTENYQRALEIQLEYLPETCSKTIETLHYLGSSYMQLNRYEESLTAFYECLEYRLNILPSDHVDVLETYNLIALVCFQLKRFEEAFQNFEICLFIQITLLPSNHSDIANTQELLGDTAIQLNNYSLAAAHYECALEIRQKHLPAMNTNVVKILKMLGNLYRELKRYDDSQRTFEQCQIFEQNEKL